MAREMTKAQKEQAKAARRLKYKTDPEYRSKVAELNRLAYRKGKKIKAKDCSGNLSALSSIGSVREVIVDKKHQYAKRVLCFTNSELAKALKIGTPTIYKWQQSGRLPLPTFSLPFAEGSTNDLAQADKVYLEAEVKVLIDIISQHQKEFRHYRESHTETMARIDSELKKIRKTVGRKKQRKKSNG